ncbi:MAG TPA: endolytic transglycosylase MltG, partial [Thermomonas sp.]|nr:endolytic transglycosylase MltG [Thermomonas sp.]
LEVGAQHHDTMASLIAAVQPAPTKALYFVARGDGSSHFSASLDEHNRAVNKYQRGGQ